MNYRVESDTAPTRDFTEREFGADWTLVKARYYASVCFQNHNARTVRIAELGGAPETLGTPKSKMPGLRNPTPIPEDFLDPNRKPGAPIGMPLTPVAPVSSPVPQPEEEPAAPAAEPEGPTVVLTDEEKKLLGEFLQDIGDGDPLDSIIDITHDPDDTRRIAEALEAKQVLAIDRKRKKMKASFTETGVELMRNLA